MTVATWNAMVAVNQEVNATVFPVSDQDHWGIEDRWDYPEDGLGDCEDIQLLKRRRLSELGFPRRAMRMSVVVDREGLGHAVLMILTDRGDFILDNKADRCCPGTRPGTSMSNGKVRTDPIGSRSAPRPRPSSRPTGEATGAPSRLRFAFESFPASRRRSKGSSTPVAPASLRPRMTPWRFPTLRAAGEWRGVAAYLAPGSGRSTPLSSRRSGAGCLGNGAPGACATVTPCGRRAMAT